MEQGARYIKQIKVAGSKQYFPNRFFSPYQLMDKLNAVAKGRYDFQVIEVKYVVSKTKASKDLEDNYHADLQPDPHFNNVFDIDDPFLQDIFKDCRLLEPPKDFDPNQYDKETQLARRQQEERRIQEVDQALELLSRIQGKSQNLELKSLPKFKMELQQKLKESEVDIYLKLALSEPVEERLEKEKNQNLPLIIPISGKQEVRAYLHPIKADPQSIDLLAKLKSITSWSLCAASPDSPSEGCSYWDTAELSSKVESINGSIKLMNYIALHRNKRGLVDAIEVYCFMFNEIVLKATVALAQITKIEEHSNQKFSHSNGRGAAEYYLRLSYPPKYSLAILKPDLGCDDGFIRSWDRVENFMFLRNPEVMENEFLRLYLFNNTFLRLRLTDQDPSYSVDQARDTLARIISDYKGTINHEVLPKPIEMSKRLTKLSTTFKYKVFRDKLTNLTGNSERGEHLWKIKYLILVLVRHNYVKPGEIEQIMELIVNNKEELEKFVYIFWSAVVSMGTINPQLEDRPFLPYLREQHEQIGKLSLEAIMKKVTSNTDDLTFVYRASLTPSGYLYHAPSPQMKGRLLKEYTKQSEHFLRVSIADESEGTLKNQRYLTKKALKDHMDKITIIQREYIPVGWSPSQLRSYSLWYLHQYKKRTKEGDEILDRGQVLSFLGNFDKIRNPAKKAARIGQAFSSSWTYLCKDGEIRQTQIEDDKSTKGYLYTDGIGKISPDLLQRISLKLKIRDLSMVQVRYKGAKGILVLQNSLPARTIIMRDSMVKYKCEHNSAARYLDILDWNKYKAGFLNRQIIILLKSLGVRDQVFMKRQSQHIERISNLTFKDCSIFKHMNDDLNTDVNNLEPANVTILHLLRAGFKLEDEPFFRGVLQTMKKNGYHQLKVKSNMVIEKSARIIGIIDEWDILEEGELYCTVIDHMQLKPKKEHVEGRVFITRNPCLHPADIRIMNCVSDEAVKERCLKKGLPHNILLQYVNCVIFPKKGDPPVTSQISGSDLDGDNFYICWDPELIPDNQEPVYLIDEAPKVETEQKSDEPAVSYDQMLDFFVEYLNYEKLGQIDNSHLVKADKGVFYAKEKECIELAEIHGKAVDFPKSGYCPEVDPKLLVSSYPDFMEKEEAPEYESQSILGKLYHDIKGRIQNLLKESEGQKAGKIDDEMIKEMVGRETNYQRDEIKEVLKILLSYERELSGLIKLVGVESEYEIYSGNFSIAKDKVRAFGKNRLIATILSLRARYFDEFFTHTRVTDKDNYAEAKEKDLENPDIFHESTRRRALLFYVCSYVIKFYQDPDFLSDEAFLPLRTLIVNEFKSLTMRSEGVFCGFVWFVVPKVMINHKYRVRRQALREKMKGDSAEKKEEHPDEEEPSDQEVI